MNKWLLACFKFLYKVKFYFNVPVSQVSFITGRIPEIAWTVLILERFGLSFTNSELVVVLLVAFVLVVVLGWFWKLAGFYDVEQYVNARKNEVSEKQLRAAELIIEKLELNYKYNAEKYTK